MMHPMHAFDVLGDPIRRRILELLAESELSSGAITAVVQAEWGISQPAVSQHLKVLRDSGFATVRPEGARRLYAVDSAPLHEVDVWLDQFRRFWEQRLDSLATELARGKRDTAPQRCSNRRIEGGPQLSIDIVREIEAIQREVGSGRIAAGEGHRVRLERAYDAPIEDVWDALTTPERISRWFLPISGDYRVGGRYQFEGNAGGEIVACDRPNRLHVTWAYGDLSDPASVSELEVRLAPVDEESTTLVLEHTAVVPDEFWTEYGPGAVGVGWDQGLLGLSLYLRTGETVGDPEAWQLSGEGREFAARSSAAWGAANEAAGADPAMVARNVASTTAFYAPDPDAAPDATA